MARYIDADALIAEYDRVHIGQAGGARKLMVDAPAADVVPRAEVAREIFEEIERKVASKIPMKFTPIFKRDLGYDAGVIDGKHAAFYEVLVLIAELKKKYTEGE